MEYFVKKCKVWTIHMNYDFHKGKMGGSNHNEDIFKFVYFVSLPKWL